MTDRRPWRRETVSVAAGRPPREPGAPINVPVTLSSTYVTGADLQYGRDSNSAWEALEEVVGELEGGRALCFASGMAAIAAVIETLPVGAVVVVPRDSYSGTRHLLTDLSGRGRLSFRTVDITATEEVLGACDGASLLWIESPTNPLLAICDLDDVCAGARGMGVPTVVDNTFATPLLQRPLERGADVVVHSATKLLSGHSDVLGGMVVSADEKWVSAVTDRRSMHGGVIGPIEAFLVLRGIRTLAVRLDKAQASAAEIASRLSLHGAVSRVWYPGLPDDPGHARAKGQMEGFGTMLSFEVGADRDGSGSPADVAEAVCARVELCTDATSLGGVETLIERRARWDFEELTPPGLIRMSVGIEDVEDIWVDLDQALSSVCAT